MDDIINIVDFNIKNLNVAKKLYKGIFIYFIGYDTSNGAELLYNVFYKRNGHIADKNGSTHLKLIPIHEKKKTF